MLVSLLIYFMHKSILSKELLSRDKLLKAHNFNFDEISTTSILNDIFSLESKSDNLENSFSTNVNILSNFKTKEKSLFIDDDESLKNEENRANLFENLFVRETKKNERSSQSDKIVESPRKFYKDGKTALDNEFFRNYFASEIKFQKQCDKELVYSLLNVKLL